MLKLEQLDPREVPAIVVAGLDTETVSITEAPGIVNDTIALTQNGDAITITSADGIFVADPSGKLVPAGDSVTVKGATSIRVGLFEGGDDTITDDTDVRVAIDAGPGNDRVSSSGGRFNPLLLPLLRQGGFDPALLPLVSEEVAKKVLAGGDGNDTVMGPVVGFFAVLDGGAGDDTVFTGFGPDVVSGGSGRDALLSTGGQDLYLAADGERDIVFGAKAAIASDPFDQFVLY